MQTRAWADVAVRGRAYQARYFVASREGRVVGTALVLRGSIGRVGLPFAVVERGPVCAEIADIPAVLDALARTALRHGVAHLHVMPYWTGSDALAAERALVTSRFSDSQRADGAHPATLRLEVEGRSDESLFQGKEHAPLRHLWREALRAGAVVRGSDSTHFDAHRTLHAHLMQRQGKRHEASSWYEALATFLGSHPGSGAVFVVEFEGQAVGSVVALRHGSLGLYAYGATSARPLRFSKSVLPLIAAIQWARDQGCAQFDLGGIPAEDDRDPKRASIARFKRLFSRTPVRLTREHARWF